MADFCIFAAEKLIVRNIRDGLKTAQKRIIGICILIVTFVLFGIWYYSIIN